MKKHLVLNIRMKFLITTLLLFSIFFILNSTFWYTYFFKESKQSSTDRINTIIHTSNNILEAYLKDIYNITTLVSIDTPYQYNTNIINLLSNPNLTDRELITYRKSAQELLSSLCSFKKYLYGMSISDFDGNDISYGVTLPYNELKNSKWFENISNMNKNTILFIPPHSSDSKDLTGNSDVISIVRPAISGDHIVGFVMADIKCDIFNDFFNQSPGTDISIVIIDSDSNEVILDSDKAILSSFNSDIPLYEKYLSVPNAQFYYQSHREKLFMVFSKSSFTGWTTVGSISNAEVMKNFYPAVKKITVISLLLWSASLLVIFGVSTILTRNLQRLSRAVKRVDKDHLDIDLPKAITSNDEVQELYNQFMNMISRIKNLVSDIRITESQKRHSQIRALQAQINPHFLHNTLSSIKFLANLQGAEHISKIAESLSGMLRINMDFRIMITLKEEINYLSNYLSIQTFRFTNNFSFEIFCDDPLFDYYIPKLLLQPIVENSLYHGIPKKSDGVIWVKIYEIDSNIIIKISDNGIGIIEAQIDTILSRKESDEHIGLNNINNRIKLYFGDAYGLSIDSQLGNYTSVEIVIPKITEGEVNSYV